MPYLCFDIGSSSLKSAVVSEDGKLLGLARRPVPLAYGDDGAHEADPDGWVDAMLSAGAEASALARSAGGLEIRALAVSGNGPTLLATDASGAPLGPALSWLDRRAVREAEEVSALAGKPIDPTFYLPKALRMWRTAETELRDRIRWFFSCPEYLLYTLSGVALTYLPHSDYEPYIWNERMLSALGLPRDRFPPFAAPASLAGTLRAAAASRLGLEPGIPVVTGFPDFLAAIVGSASVEIGIACDRSGTSEAINLCASRPFPTRALLSLRHPVEGLWNVSGGLSTSGAALEWLADILAPAVEGKKEAAVAGLLAEARKCPPGARGLVFLPYLAGERAPLWDAERRAAFVGLSVGHGRSEMARALCESLAYSLKLASNLAIAEGMPFKLLRVSGQAAANDFLNELKADIFGIPVEAPTIVDCELVGDAAACALAIGDAESLSQSAASLVRIRRRFDPRPIRGLRESFLLVRVGVIRPRPRGSPSVNISSSVVQTLVLFILMAVGFGAGKARVLDEAGVKGISRLLVNFILPALIIESMQRPFTPELRDFAYKMLGASFLAYAAAFPLSWLFVRAIGAKGPERGADTFGAIFSNCAFMGFPVVEAIFGKDAIFAASIANIPFQLLAFSVGPYICSPRPREEK